MTPSPMPRGLWGVLATPFHGPRLDVDTESLRREVDPYLGVPADGLVVLESSARVSRWTQPSRPRW